MLDFWARERIFERSLEDTQSGKPYIFYDGPPFATGLTFMDRMSLVDPGAEAAVISKYPQVERVIAGHHHRTAQARFAGTVASICPSTAHQLLLDLVPGADIRFTLEPSGFQLHLWDGRQLVTHTTVVEDFKTWSTRD